MSPFSLFIFKKRSIVLKSEALQRLRTEMIISSARVRGNIILRMEEVYIYTTYIIDLEGTTWVILPID